jgi:predicted Zn finger-like uncharacterized protein
MLLTTCTNCGAQFKVAPDQLNIRQGRVMCGRCRHVFNAFETLKRVPDDAPVETIEIRQPPQTSSAGGTPERTPNTTPDKTLPISASIFAVAAQNVLPAHTETTPPTPSMEAQEEAREETPPQFAFREKAVPAELQAAAFFDPPVSPPAPAPTTSPAPNYSTRPEDAPSSTPLMMPLSAPLPDIDDEPAPTSAIITPALRPQQASSQYDMRNMTDMRFTPNITVARDTAAPPITRRANEPAPEKRDEPEEARDVSEPIIKRVSVTAPSVDYYPPSTDVPTGNVLLDGDTPEKESAPSRIWIWLAFLAMVALPLQAAYYFRSEIVQRYPESRPALDTACSYLKCTIPWGRNRELMLIESSDLIEPPGKPGKILLTATLVNRGTTKQDFPSLEVKLTDAANGILASRVLTPAEYLGRLPSPEEGLAPNAELYVNLNLELAGPTPASGYGLRAFYP